MLTIKQLSMSFAMFLAMVLLNNVSYATAKVSAPSLQSREGTINDIDIAESRMFVDRRLYYISPGLVVYSPIGKLTRPSSLVSGKKIRMDVELHGENSPASVHTIYILK